MYSDYEYFNLVNDILENENFKKMNDITHHGITRFDHSIRVSYFSYRIAKFLRLDSKKIARAALLHDFFFEDNLTSTKKERFTTLIKHPQYAKNNAKKYFELSELEEDIILTHMFPISLKLPKYLESWVVDIVDDFAAIYERSYVIQKQLSTASCFLVMMFVNYLR